MGPEEQYQAHLAEGDIKLQRCDNCHATIFYPGFYVLTAARLTWNGKLFRATEKFIQQRLPADVRIAAEILISHWSSFLKVRACLAMLKTLSLTVLKSA